MSRAQEVKPPAGVRISGTGMSVPERVLTNADLESIVETSEDWIIQRTGIHERRIVENGQSTVDLAAGAVQQALENANLSPQDLDLVIVATLTPDMICPATAPQVVDRIGAVPCGGMDVSVACTGFVVALNTAANFIRTGFYRNIAVVGAERLSSITDWKDRRTCILFGDGAGAAILSATDDTAKGCLYQTMGSDGSRWLDLYCPRNEGQVPKGTEFTGAFNTLQMNGREVYKFAVTTFQAIIKDAMDACDLGPDDVKVVIPHQSNFRIIESARDKLGFGKDRVYVNIDRYGNTSAASVGLCLHELMDQGRLEEGDHVIFVAFGGGLTWASSVWRL